MIDILSERLDLVKKALSAHLQEHENIYLIDLEIVGKSSRAFSDIVYIKARTSRDVLRLVMKSVVQHPVNEPVTSRENQAIVEFNILKILYPKFYQIGKCAVPRPILVVPEIQTFLMEYVEGNLLSDEFRYARYLSSMRMFEALNENCYYCGKWLKHFQEFTCLRASGTQALKGIMERCDYRLGLIENLNDPRWPKTLRNRIIKYLNKRFEELEGESDQVYICGRHGDFGSWNVIFGPSGITVIDFLGYEEDVSAVDFLKMLMSFEDGKKYLAYSSKRIEILRDSFLEGFGSPPFTPLPARIIIEAYHRICSTLACLSTKEKQFHRRIERHLCLKANLKWLTDYRRRELLWRDQNLL